MRRSRKSLALVSVIAFVGLIGAHAHLAAGEGESDPTAEEIARQWSFPDREFSSTHQGGGPLRLRIDVVEVRGSYDETLAEIDKFYSQRCGSNVNHAEPGKILLYDKAQTKQGGESLISTLHMYQKDIVYIHATKDYTINVFVRPGRREDRIEIILTVATR